MLLKREVAVRDEVEEVGWGPQFLSVFCLLNLDSDGREEGAWLLVQRWLCRATSLQTVRALGDRYPSLKANLSGITTLDILQSSFILDAHGSLVRNVE